MFNGILLFYLISIISCYKLQKLPKYDVIDVSPDTRVYLDISSFNVSESINLEYTMNLIFSLESKDNYTFQIGQVFCEDYHDYRCWRNLPTYINENVTESDKFTYTFSWTEIKQEGMNYIFTIPPAPYESFNFYRLKITIKNTGGVSDREKSEKLDKDIKIPKILTPILLTIISSAFIVAIIFFSKRNVKRNMLIFLLIIQ